MEDALARCLQDLKVAMFIKDLEGRYMSIDRRGAAMLGLSIEEILGLDDTRFFESGHADQIMVRDRFILSGRDPVAYESLAEVRASGAVTHFQSIKLPLRNGPRDSLSGLLGLSFVSNAGREEFERETRELMGFLAHKRADRLLPLVRRQSRLIF